MYKKRGISWRKSGDMSCIYEVYSAKFWLENNNSCCRTHTRSQRQTPATVKYIFQDTDCRAIAPVWLECLWPLCGSYSQTAAGEVRFKLCDYVLAHDTAVLGTDLRQKRKIKKYSKGLKNVHYIVLVT